MRDAPSEELLQRQVERMRRAMAQHEQRIKTLSGVTRTLLRQQKELLDAITDVRLALVSEELGEQ